jgi:hypothetical protein
MLPRYHVSQHGRRARAHASSSTVLGDNHDLTGTDSYILHDILRTTPFAMADPTSQPGRGEGLVDFPARRRRGPAPIHLSHVTLSLVGMFQSRALTLRR